MARPQTLFDFADLTNPLLLYAPVDQELLRRCATVHVCEPVVFEAVLHSGLEGAMSFEKLAALHFVERLPGPNTAGSCAIRGRRFSKPGGATASRVAAPGISKPYLRRCWNSANDWPSSIVPWAIRWSSSITWPYAIHWLPHNCSTSSLLLRTASLTSRSARQSCAHLKSGRRAGPRTGARTARDAGGEAASSRHPCPVLWAQEYRTTIPMRRRTQRDAAPAGGTAEGSAALAAQSQRPRRTANTYIRAVVARHCALEGVPCVKDRF